MTCARQPKLMKRAMVLANIEDPCNTDSITNLLDPAKRLLAILCSNPVFSVDPTVLQRDFVKNDISPTGTLVGRMLNSVTFSVELRGNGNQNTASTTSPRIGRLLRACGFEETEVETADKYPAATTDKTYADLNNTSTDTITGWATSSSSPVDNSFGIFKTKTVLGGASATAKLLVYGGVKGSDVATPQSAEIIAWVVSKNISNPTQLTVTVDQTTAVESPTITVAGTPLSAGGEVVMCNAFGYDASYTTAASDTVSDIAAGLVQAIIDSNIILFDATIVANSSGVITILTGTSHADTYTVPTATYTGTYTVKISGNSYTYVASAEDQDAVATGIAAAMALDTTNFASASATLAVITFTLASEHTSAKRLEATAITSGSTALILGSTDYTMTPTFTGSLTLGNIYHTIIAPTGYKYKPVSENFESVTIHLSDEDTLHKMTGCRGTFTLNAQAGNFGTLEFTFTGNYVTPITQPMLSSPTYETTNPPQIELAELRMDDYDKFVVDTITYDQANTITPRSDVNEADGYAGVYITERAPTGTVDPELVTPDEKNSWDIMSNSEYLTYQVKFGQTDGNIIYMVALGMQLTNVADADRDSFRTTPWDQSFARNAGDDEIYFFFA